MPVWTNLPVFREEDLYPISALQHLLFCERQCALIHLEQVWADNRLTAEGRTLHERVHEQALETRGNTRIVRALRIRSLALGLVGQADVVEFHENGDGIWEPYPIEYKRGCSKMNDCDRVQLCAQAMCLEEMLGVTIVEGALFYASTRRRERVILTEELRNAVKAAATRLRSLLEKGETPQALYEKKCDSCSLVGICQPRLFRRSRHVEGYLQSAADLE